MQSTSRQSSPGAEHQAVQRIARDGARQHRADRVAEPLGDRIEIGLRRAERQHAQRRDHRGRAVGGCDAQLLRVDDADAEAVDERQQVGEQQRLAAEKDVERRDLAPLVAVVEVERKVRDARRGERFERDDAAHRVDRVRRDAQQLREAVAVAVGELGALALAEAQRQRGLEAVLPARRELLDFGLEPGPIRRREPAADGRAEVVEDRGARLRGTRRDRRRRSRRCRLRDGRGCARADPRRSARAAATRRRRASGRGDRRAARGACRSSPSDSTISWISAATPSTSVPSSTSSGAESKAPRIAR